MGWWAALGQQTAGAAAQGGMDLGTMLAGKAWGAGIDRRNWEKAWPQQQKMMRFQQELGLDYWNKTNAEAQVQHLKNAGLNVGLMYQGGGPGGSTVQPSVPQGPATGMGLSGIRMQTAAEINLMNAQTEKVKAEAEKIKGVDTDQTSTNIKNVELKNKLQAIENEIAEATKANNIEAIKEGLRKLKGEAQSAETKGEVENATKIDVIEQVEQRTTEQFIEIQAKRQGLTKTSAEITAIKAGIKRVSAEIRKWTTEQIQAWDKLSQNEREVKVKELLGEAGGHMTEFQTNTPQQIGQWSKIITDVINTLK